MEHARCEMAQTWVAQTLCHMTQVKLIKLKFAMVLMNIQSDWMSNASSALYNFYYTDSHLGVQLQVYI